MRVLTLFSRSHIAYALVCLCLTFSTALNAQSDVRKGWDHFTKNDLKAAQQVFSNIEGADKAQAKLGLSWVAMAASDEASAFKYFDAFTQLAQEPTPYIHTAWWSILGGSAATESEADFMLRMTNHPDGKIRAKASQALGRYYRSKNEHNKSESYFARTQGLKTWQMVGVFENISESGFDQNYWPIRKPQPGVSFKNKRGIDVKWFDLKAPREDNWIDFEYHFYTGNSIIYAQTFCNSTQQQDVQFRVGTSGSLKVWVNDKLQFQEAEERDNGLDTYVFTGRLMKGYNRILVQIGSSEIDNSNFLMRITDETGKPIEGLTYSPGFRPYAENYDFQGEVVADKAAGFFLTKIEEEPNAIENYLILSQYFLSTDKIYQAKKILKQALEKFPDCSFLNYQMIQLYARDDNETGLSTYLEKIKQNDPDNALAQELLFDEAVELENYEKAEEILKSIEKREGYSPNVINKKIEIAGEKDENESMISLVNQGYNLFPEEFNFVFLKYLIETEKKNTSYATKIIKKYLKKNYNEQAIRIMASEYFKAGNITAGVKEFEKLLDMNPIATGYYSQMASLMYRLGNYSRAESYVQECIKIAPYRDSYHETLGETYSEMGRTSMAKEALEKAIFYNPYNYDAREKLRNIQGDKDIFSYFEEEDVYKL